MVGTNKSQKIEVGDLIIFYHNSIGYITKIKDYKLFYIWIRKNNISKTEGSQRFAQQCIINNGWELIKIKK